MRMAELPFDDGQEKTASLMPLSGRRRGFHRGYAPWRVLCVIRTTCLAIPDSFHHPCYENGIQRCKTQLEISYGALMGFRPGTDETADQWLLDRIPSVLKLVRIP